MMPDRPITPILDLRPPQVKCENGGMSPVEFRDDRIAETFERHFKRAQDEAVGLVKARFCPKRCGKDGDDCPQGCEEAYEVASRLIDRLIAFHIRMN